MREFPLTQADFSGIGSDIATGAAHALWGIVSAIPIGVWAVLFVALLAVVFILRYATNWKVDLAALIVMVIVSEILVYRAHWIAVGYAEAQAQVKAAQVREAGYKSTEALIIACYAQDSHQLDWVWDRTVGTCKRVDGSQ